jgi:hypothetical protein
MKFVILFIVSNIIIPIKLIIKLKKPELKRLKIKMEKMKLLLKRLLDAIRVYMNIIIQMI